jgi:aryl-alcohol dehydrogenase-like predicted oxidoreductase
MDTVKLGHTGQDVSALCLGTMYFGTTTDEETSRRLLDRYVEAGGRFLDTANAYARWVEGFQGGESETLLGRWFRDRGNRDEIFLATKVGFPTPADGTEFGLSAGQIESACEASLKRMGTDHIDLYYAHNDDRHHPMEERLEAFHRLVKAGKVRYIGASNTMDWRLEEARCVSKAKGYPEFCAIQQRYTYVRPQAGAVYDPHCVVNDELLDYARNRGTTIVAYSPLAGGAYTRDDKSFPDEYLGPDTDRRLSALNQVAEEANATPNQVVLAWMLRSEPIVIPITAASSLSQLDENLASLDVSLDGDQLTRLSQAGNIRQQNPLGQRKIVPGMKEG